MIGESIVEVAAAALVRADGCVLVMQRLPGTPYAGRWEFPGGKLEAGEYAASALRRELGEELGVVPVAGRPLIRIRHDYPERRVRLDCARVDAWRGEIVAREGHALAWAAPDELFRYDMLDADRPIVAALRLPPRYAVTRDARAADIRTHVAQLLDRGHTLLQLRAPSLATDGFTALAREALVLCRARGARLLVNASADLALALGTDGVHLSAERLMACDARPLPADRWVGASCHDAAELAHARAIGCDFAVLGPVAPTASHPRATPLGWAAFAALADCAGLPVYAIGGLGETDLATSWQHHGQGVAGISQM